MSEYLPYERLKWLKNVDKFDVMSFSKKKLIGYIVEIHFKYPDELHGLRNDYLPAPEKLAVSSDILSKYSKRIADK